MTDLAAPANSVRTFHPGFFFWTCVALALVIFGGFGISYIQPIASGSLRPMSPIVHVHGLFYFTWMVLLVVQSGLVSSGNVMLHRTLGTLGISVATGLIIFATVITILNIAVTLETSTDPFVFGLMYLSLAAIVSFTILFIMAMNKTRQPDYHRRYMLLATVAFIGAGINRFYVFLFDVQFAPFWFLNACADLFIVALALYDWKSLGRLHPATLTGGSIVITIQILQWPIAGTDSFASFTYWLVSLSGYDIFLPG